MNTKEVLIAARQKIERPECWTQGDYARNSKGRGRDHHSDDAVCWCAIGALRAVVTDSEDAWRAVRALGRGLPAHEHVAQFNDRESTTHADVLALFDRAIAEAT